MKYRLRAILLRWVITWGMCVPGAMPHPDMVSMLTDPNALNPKTPPPRHGPERMPLPDLTPAEQELWDCLRGHHGSDCARAA
jgi:hypothetical protein